MEINAENETLFSVLDELNIKRTKQKLFCIFFGILGDFDSIEYGLNIMKDFDRIINNGYEIIIIAIGTKECKKRFSSYTGLPVDLIKVIDTDSYHQKLKLDKGLKITPNSSINLLLMCAGLYSPGTLKEVIRGYIGDRQSRSIYNINQQIKIGAIKISSNLFSIIGSDKYQRPFELATYRLQNMIEVISNYSLYFSHSEFITQRGGTFIVESRKFLYTYRPKSILGYSHTMNDPLKFMHSLYKC